MWAHVCWVYACVVADLLSPVGIQWSGSDDSRLLSSLDLWWGLEEESSPRTNTHNCSNSPHSHKKHVGRSGGSLQSEGLKQEPDRSIPWCMWAAVGRSPMSAHLWRMASRSKVVEPTPGSPLTSWPTYLLCPQTTWTADPEMTGSPVTWHPWLVGCEMWSETQQVPTPRAFINKSKSPGLLSSHKKTCSGIKMGTKFHCYACQQLELNKQKSKSAITGS